jgi:hypothetical protein
MLAVKKMMIMMMPFGLIALVVAATTHRHIGAGDRLIVTTDRLIVAGDRDFVSEAPHLVAAEESWLDSHWSIVADRRSGMRLKL